MTNHILRIVFSIAGLWLIYVTLQSGNLYYIFDWTSYKMVRFNLLSSVSWLALSFFLLREAVIITKHKL